MSICATSAAEHIQHRRGARAKGRPYGRHGRQGRQPGYGRHGPQAGLDSRPNGQHTRPARRAARLPSHADGRSTGDSGGSSRAFLAEPRRPVLSDAAASVDATDPGRRRHPDALGARALASRLPTHPVQPIQRTQLRRGRSHSQRPSAQHPGSQLQRGSRACQRIWPGCGERAATGCRARLAVWRVRRGGDTGDGGHAACWAVVAGAIVSALTGPTMARCGAARPGESP